MEASTAVATIPEEERQLRGLELAERHFPPERRAQVAAFLEIGPEDPALLPYLAWCASMNLSPISGHVWLIPKKIKGRDGQEDRYIYKPAIGRDGLLHKARETKGKPGGFRGMQFGVVCERDTFEVEYTGDLVSDPKVLHRFASKPTEFSEDEAPDRYRGRVIGAWAKCQIDGEPPVFYYANLREHGRLRQMWDYNPATNNRRPLYLDGQGKLTFAEFGDGGIRNRPKMEWEGAWDYTSSMILKAAQSYVVRTGLGVTGVVPVDELRDAEAWKRGEDGTRDEGVFASVSEVEFDFEAIADEDLRGRLRRAVDAANAQDEFAWPPAKCEMVFGGRSNDELAGIVEQIERENDLREQRAARASGGETVTDAEVVEEEPAAAGEKVAEPASTGDAVGEEQVGRIDELRRRGAELTEALAFCSSDTEESRMRAELDQVEAEIRNLGGSVPGQEPLDL